MNSICNGNNVVGPSRGVAVKSSQATSTHSVMILIYFIKSLASQLWAEMEVKSISE